MDLTGQVRSSGPRRPTSASCYSYLAWLTTALTWITLLQCQPAGCSQFHLALPGGGCSALTTLGATVDFVCQYFDHGDPQHTSAGRRSRDPARAHHGGGSGSGPKEPACTVTGLRWQRLAVGRMYNITDSDKFGVWTAIPGWGMRKTEHISLLRVRRVRPEDVGTYRCEISCAEMAKGGQRQTLTRTAKLALAQPNKAYTVEGIDVADSFCARSFRDGVCQLECETERHLYDGFDCSTSLTQCADDDVCKPRFANGFCDRECDNSECGWDGGDCIDSTLKLSDDTVALFLARRQASANIHLKALGRSLTSLLQTIVRVLPSNWNGAHNEVKARESYYTSPQQVPSPAPKPLEQVLYLKLDNTKCKNNCFKKAERSAHFIALALQKGWDPGISISAVTVVTRLQVDQQCPLENNTRLDINLAAVDRGQHQQGAGEGFMDLGLQPWVLVAAVASGLALLLLVITLTLVMCRMLTNRHKRCRRDSFDLYDSTARIRSEKAPPGTDV